jgi:hypothetical protein
MTYIFLLFKFFLILSVSFNISSFYKKNFYIVNLLLLIFYAFFLIFFAYLDKFSLGVVIIHIFFFLNFFIFLFNLKKNSLKEFTYYYIILIIFLLILGEKYFYIWDEFSFWGSKTKEIFINKSIFSENPATSFLNKSFILPSFHNLILFGLKSFNETVVVYSQIFLNLSAILFIGSFFKKNFFIKNSLFIIYFYFVTAIFNYGIYSIYIDVFTSLIFLCFFIFFFKNHEKFSSFDYLITILLITFLACIKEIGFFYSLMSLFIIIAFVVIKRFSLYSFIKIFLAVFILSFFFYYLFFYNFSKNIFDHNKYSLGLDNQVLIANFLKAFYTNNVFEGSFLNFFNKFIKYIYSDHVEFFFIKHNLIYWLIINFLISIYSIFLNKFDKYTEIYLFFIILIIFCFYATFLFLSYKFIFGGYEGLILASFGRYFGIFFLFWTSYNFYKLINHINLRCNINSLLIFFLYFLIIFSSSGKAYENLFLSRVDSTNNISSQSTFLKKRKIIINLYKNFNNSDKILIIDDNGDGFWFLVAKYIFYPINTNKSCWSYSLDLKSQKQYDCVLSDIDMQKLLKNFHYLLIINNDDFLIKYNIKNSLDLVSSQDQTLLFKIINDN